MRWAGAADVARRDKTKEACERRICPSMSRPFAAGPASSLFVVVEGVLDVMRTRYWYSHLLHVTVFPSYFMLLFWPVLLKNILEITKGCLLLLAAVFLPFRYFRVSTSAKVYLSQGRMVVLYYISEAAQPTT